MTAPEPSDFDLVEAFRRGDAGAVDVLLERHGPSLMAYLRGAAANAEEARDAFQETWLRAIRHLHGFRRGSFRAWLTTIARHWLIDRARRRRPVVSLDAGSEDGEGPALLEQLAGDGPSPAAALMSEEELRRVARLVAGLPPAQREVFLMRTQQELSFAEIARILGIPLNTALGRMHYAVTKLRRALEPENERGKS